MFITEAYSTAADLKFKSKNIAAVNYAASGRNVDFGNDSVRSSVDAAVHADLVHCRKCRVPLAGRNQFLGHMVFSHEVRLRQAKREWGRVAMPSTHDRPSEEAHI
jgi:hypothetical protein